VGGGGGGGLGGGVGGGGGGGGGLWVGVGGEGWKITRLTSGSAGPKLLEQRRTLPPD